ncbi:MAG: FAD-binding oxidoreductase [Deltaproteobacteria bacterium]|nr:FAD-binding oxidoreductase [Deltaproteobacteria bacterium]
MVELKKALEELIGIAGPDRLKADPSVTAQYAVDGVIPKAVVFPKDTRMVAALVQCACRGNLAIVPWGSGTKMAMGNPPKRLDLVLCMARMNHMLDVDTANLTITVEAGVKFRDVQARLATEEDRCYLPLEDLKTEAGEFVCSDRSHSGCFLPMDPPFSERATMGGVVATNTTGPRRLLYGLPRDLVLGVRFVTPKGDIIGAGGKTVKNVSGYDVSKLMIGSLGSLGILCEMTLRLLPLPEKMETLLFSFDAFSDAGAFAAAILGTKLLPAAVEVANKAAIENMDLRGSLDFSPGSHVVMVALEAFDEAVARMHKELLAMAQHFKAKGHSLVQEDKHRLFWLTVGELQGSAHQRFPRLVALQLNYPLSAWKALFEFADKTLSQARLDHTMLCHAGNSVTLINLLSGTKGTDDKALIEAVQALLAECRKAGGNLVVQRAPADLKKALPVWGEPGSDLPLMKRIRVELDPLGVMNPGRFAVGL